MKLLVRWLNPDFYSKLYQHHYSKLEEIKDAFLRMLEEV